MRFLKSHRVLLFVFGLAALLGSYTTTLQSLEEFSYDLFVRLLPTIPTPPRAAVIAIDDKALKAYGPWPWPRQQLAEIIKRLEKLSVGAIGVILPLDQPQSLSLPSNYQSVLENAEPEVRDKVEKLMDQLDPDAIFTNTLIKSEKVILAVPYWSKQTGLVEPIANDLSMILQGLRMKLAKTSGELILNALVAPPPTKTHLGKPPVASFAQAAKAVGLVRLGRDGEHVLTESLAVLWENRYVPAFALQVAALTVGVPLEDIIVLDSRGIRFGNGLYSTDAALRYYPKPVFDHPDEPPRIPVYSVVDLLNGKISKSDLKNTATLVGFTAPGTAPTFTGPGGMQVTPVGWSAHIVDSLLGGTSIYTPYWSLGLQRGLILVFTLYMLFLPYKLRGRSGQVVSLLIAVLLINTSLLMLLVQSTWLPLTLPALFLVTSHLLLTFYHHVKVLIGSQRHEAAAAYRELAENLQNQGNLDRAFDNLRKCKMDDSLMEPLYILALDYERRRQFGKALIVYDYMTEWDPRYKDIKERKERHQSVPEASLFTNSGNSNLTATLLVDDSKVERPVLGRYRIDSELGRGAMGMVYLGHDPKIGRTVAIKTLALANEFDSMHLGEARERFFLEAEAAGRLNHPNIVTIYDASEEHDLAYIAMNYIENDSLDVYTAPDNLLPIDEVFQIGMSVADALQYAHKKKVVHRDIKPSNILYDRNSGTLKVTDFGVACLTDTSKTRTGTVLGSPSYMSPEQLEGKKVDGRSDIYSLGVTLYQLFTGDLPFKAETMASLAYKIINEKPKGIRRIRSDLPVCLTRIVNKAMEKNPKQRFQDAEALAEALRRCAPG